MTPKAGDQTEVVPSETAVGASEGAAKQDVRELQVLIRLPLGWKMLNEGRAISTRFWAVTVPHLVSLGRTCRRQVDEAFWVGPGVS